MSSDFFQIALKNFEFGSLEETFEDAIFGSMNGGIGGGILNNMGSTLQL